MKPHSLPLASGSVPPKKPTTVQAQVGARRRAATSSDILAATRRLLDAGEPVAGLSVERIGAEAGVSRATFYLHFQDKHELISRLADELFAWRDEEWVASLAAPDLTRETLLEIMRNIVSQWVENQAVLAAIIELAAYEPSMRDAWRGAMHEVAERAAAQFDAHWADSPDRPTDPAMIAEVFTWMFERSCQQIATDPSREDAVVEAMAEIIWRVLDYSVS